MKHQRDCMYRHDAKETPCPLPGTSNMPWSLWAVASQARDLYEMSAKDARERGDEQSAQFWTSHREVVERSMQAAKVAHGMPGSQSSGDTGGEK